MSRLSHLAKVFSRTPSSVRAGLLGFGLAFAFIDPSLAAGAGIDCVLGSKEQPARVIAACSAIIDDPAASRTGRAAALVAQAEAHARTSGGLVQALAELDRAIALDDRNGDAFRLRGDLTREGGGSLARAEADFTHAIALNPDDAQAYELRGVIYTSQRRIDRAIADYDRAIKLQPGNAQAWSDRGVTWYFAGDYNKAIRDADEALRLDPARDRTLANRAAAFGKLGQYDNALADENEAIRLDPREAIYYDNRGLTWSDMKQYDKALADYDQAIRLEARANFYTHRGDANQFKGDLGAALNDYGSALWLDPNSEATYNNRAVLYKKMGERAKALADYEAALRLNPGNENAAGGRKTMKAEIARFGAEAPRPQTAADAHPSFDCGAARLPVEKAICADAQLGMLDREIADTYGHLLSIKGSRAANALRQAQRNFIAERNARFGKPGYDLQLALQARLGALEDAVR
jgi:tetratricopeptide (TPR) repeat protein